VLTPLYLRSSLGLTLGAGLLALGVAAAIAALTSAPAASPASPASPAERRVAIRVDCGAGCAVVEELALDVWSEQRAPGDPLDVVVPSAALAALRAAGAEWTVIDPDIDSSARREAARIQAFVTSENNADFFAEFRDHAAIEAHLFQLAESAPSRAQVQGIGSTLDGRTIWALHLTPEKRPAAVDAVDDVAAAAPLPMLINGTQHAREWISAMSATCIADRLVRNYESDAAVRAFVDSTDLWIVPVVNPDGYQHTWAADRYWRKNRRGGFGVDLNRNFSVAWGGAGSSGLKRSDTYRGDKPFSEPETTALRSLVKREGIRAHVDLHAYGQLVLFPWMYTGDRTDDHARLAAIGDDVASAIYATHQNKYRLMRGVELYPASGTMTDWMHGEAGATSFTIELRPRGGGGFVLPPKEIRPTCDEAMAAVLALRGSRHLR
jgi:carboxypeptidase T